MQERCEFTILEKKIGVFALKVHNLEDSSFTLETKSDRNGSGA